MENCICNEKIVCKTVLGNILKKLWKEKLKKKLEKLFFFKKNLSFQRGKSSEVKTLGSRDDLKSPIRLKLSVADFLGWECFNTPGEYEKKKKKKNKK